MYQALYRKWRPRSFDDVVGQEHITTTLKRQVASNRLSHAYLFTGTRGTGKTTCAKLLARAVNCEHPVDGSPCNECTSCVGIENGSILDVLELDAASNSRVDDIRAILDEAAYTPASVKKRVYIIDEVHAISPQAFNALLQILEEPPEHLMFILATTEIHKVPATIKSRCQQFAFKRIHADSIAARLNYIAQQENLPLTSEGAALLARLADGGMRDALSLLDQCTGDHKTIGEPEILAAMGLAGNVDTARLMNAVINGEVESALTQLDRLYSAGKEMAALVGELSSFIRDVLIYKTAPKAGSALMTGGFDSATLRSMSASLSTPRLTHILTVLQDTAANLARSANRRTDMELCLLSLCDPALDTSAAALTARMDDLERRLEQGIPVQMVSMPVPVQTQQPSSPPEQETRPEPEPVQEQESVPDDFDGPPFWYSDEDAPPEAGAPREYDAPPWDEPEPLILENNEPPQERVLPPAIPKTEPVKSAEPKPIPVPVKKAAAAQPVGASVASGDWKTLSCRLEKVMNVADFCFVGNPTMVIGDIRGDTVTLWADTQMIKTLINKPDITGTISETARSLWGKEFFTVVKVGKPPASPVPVQQESQPAIEAEPEHDALDEFLEENLKQGNIAITD